MPLIDARADLERYLTTTDWTLLVLVEDQRKSGEAIQGKAERAFAQEQTQRKTLLLADTALLTPAEASWGLAPGRFVVLGRHTRRVVQAGASTELEEAGAPSIRPIRRAFHGGDAG